MRIPRTTCCSSSTTTSARAARCASTAARPGVIIMGKAGAADGDGRHPRSDQQPRLRLRHAVLSGRRRVAKTFDDQPKPSLKERMTKAGDSVQGSPGLELDLPARLDLPQGLHRQPPEPLLRRHELGAVPPAPGQGEAPRGEGQLHAVPRRSVSFFLFILLTVTGIFLMFFYRPDRRAGLERHLQPADVGDLRAPRAQHAPMGRAPHGAVGVPAHGPGLLPRRLQAAAGVQLGHRRDPADAHPAAVASPATCCRGTSCRCGP